MPFYRMNGMTVHVKGSKTLPKPCAANAWIDGQAQPCMVWSEFLCDGPGEAGRTCDKPLCEAHATQIGKNKHLCPDCRATHAPLGQGSLFTSLVKS